MSKEVEFSEIPIEWKKVSGIYCLKINKRKYVGSAVDLYGRVHQHKSNILRGTHVNNFVERSANKYKVVEVGILEICEKEELIEREQFYIDTLKPKMNLRKKAHSNLGMRESEETRRKKSKAMKKWHREVGFSKETLRKMSKVAKGRKPHKNTIEGAKRARTGRPLSEETKAKLSKAAKKSRKKSKNYDFRGEKNPQSKLKDSQVEEILKRLEDRETGVKIAKDFGVSKYCISLIKTGKSYKHIKR